MVPVCVNSLEQVIRDPLNTEEVGRVHLSTQEPLE